jgi:hypothetical protein
MLNNWKNGVLIDKERKFKALAATVLGGEIICSTAAVYGSIFNSEFLGTSIIAGAYALVGAYAATNDSVPKACNILHSNLTSILLCILIISRVGTDSAALLALSAPFLLDGLFSLGAIYQAFRLLALQNLR